MGQSFTKGEVVNVDLGSPPKEVKGHEQGYDRPCLVIKAFNSLNLAIVVPLTTKEPKYSPYTTVKIPKGTAGLTHDSYALCHQIRTISFDRIKDRWGNLPSLHLLKVRAVLLDILEL